MVLGATLRFTEPLRVCWTDNERDISALLPHSPGYVSRQLYLLVRHRQGEGVRGAATLRQGQVGAMMLETGETGPPPTALSTATTRGPRRRGPLSLAVCRISTDQDDPSLGGSARVGQANGPPNAGLMILLV